jgi:hypothetical protein
VAFTQGLADVQFVGEFIGTEMMYPVDAKVEKYRMTLYRSGV